MALIPWRIRVDIEFLSSLVKNSRNFPVVSVQDIEKVMIFSSEPVRTYPIKAKKSWARTEDA